MTRLALVVIARDEERSIARCLESAAPFVDRMVVLDTGSKDRTRDVAAGCGAEVHGFTWIDDFGAARNAALDLADADWNLILDADEWLEEGGSALGRENLPPAPERPFIGWMEVVSDVAQGDGVGRSRSRGPRVLPRGVRYEGRVHELPVSDLPTALLPSVIGHSGYLPENLARKEGRNERLLLKALEAAPDDGYLWYQLGKERLVRGRPGEAAACLVEALALVGPDAAYRPALVVRCLAALKAADRLEEAIALADQEFAGGDASADFMFTVGDVYLTAAAQWPDRALRDFLPVAEFAWKRCLEIGETPEAAVDGRGGHLAAHNLAVLYETLGAAEAASNYRALAEALRAAA